MAKKQVIELVLADLNLQKHPNYKAAAEKYSIEQTILAPWYKSVIISQEKFASLHKKKLTDVQEQELLEHMIKLLDCGLSPTEDCWESCVWDYKRVCWREVSESLLQSIQERDQQHL